jgi:tRNA A-37 threonylcarbamoyl transferase component Bud32
LTNLVGKRLKDYQVVRRLGRGAMADVYLSQQLSLGRQVALKVLNAELARDPVCVQRFHQEARAAAALVHGGIVQIYEVGQEDGVHFIAQEYVPGRNLGEVIRSHGALEPRLVLDILRQVAAALGKAASEGIVHRDIKPENIMLSRSGEVKVADFGLARVQGDGGVNLTQIGVTMGTPLYMSPEQIEGRPLDPRSDIYSLGVMAYHMLAGAPPFTGDTPLAVAVQHLNQSPEPLSRRRPDVPARLAAVIERMLAKKPADRYADPQALLRQLHALATEGAKEGWSSGPEHWSFAELVAAADDRAEATSRLDRVMKTGALARRRPALRGWLLAGLIGCLLIGAGLAAVVRPRSLLADAQIGPAKRDNAWAQLYHAKIVDTEPAWLAVAEYFPNADQYCHNLAKQGLARYYLFRTRDYPAALKPLQQLADLGPSQSTLQTFGIAGLVVAHAKLGDINQAGNENGQLTAPMREQLRQRDPQMADALEQTLAELDRPAS